MTDVRSLCTDIRTLLCAMCLLLGVGATCGAAGDELPDAVGAFHAISVADIESAIDWYSRILDFEVGPLAENAERKGALLRRDGVTVELAEFAAATARESGTEAYQQFGIFKLGFFVVDLDKTFDELRSRGAEVFFPIVDIDDDQRCFGIRDMDGNIIQFFGE